MNDTSTEHIELVDRICDIREDIRLISILLRGAMEIAEHDGPDTRTLLRQHGGERQLNCYDSITLSLYYVYEQLEAIAWPV